MALEMIPGFVAKCQTINCLQHVAIPAPSPPESFEVRPYSPAGSWPLLFACPECTRGSVFAPSDFHFDMIPNPRLGGDDRVWWCVEVLCSTDNCGLPLTIHTVTSDKHIPDDVMRIVGPTFDRFRCPSRHQLSLPISVLRQPVKLGERSYYSVVCTFCKQSIPLIEYDPRYSYSLPSEFTVIHAVQDPIFSCELPYRYTYNGVERRNFVNGWAIAPSPHEDFLKARHER
jgi:hypothetical protein